jgi:hypothetical protein
VEEICRFVEAQNVCNFDYLVFVLSAAVIACLGLATISAAVVVAAMLISPLMGPIVGTLSAVTHSNDLHNNSRSVASAPNRIVCVAVALGAAIREWGMVVRGLTNELLGTLLVFITGFVWGLGTSTFSGPWDTDEQLVRPTPAHSPPTHCPNRVAYYVRAEVPTGRA